MSTYLDKAAMNRLRQKRVILLAILVMVWSAHASIVKKNTTNALPQPAPIAANALAKTYTFKQLKWDSSVTLNGYNPEYTFYFPIPKQFSMQKIMLHLKVGFSEKLSAGTRIDLKLNQTLLRRLIMPETPTGLVQWDIELPLGSLTRDWQALTFSAYFASKVSFCDPEVYAYISPESSLSMDYLELPFSSPLNKFPYPFIDSTALKPVSTVLVLPNNPSPQEIIAQFQVAKRFGELAGDAKTVLSTDYVDNFQQSTKKNSNVLLVGLANNLFNKTQYPWSYLTQDGKITNALKNEWGVIMLAPSPMDSNSALLAITGMNVLALQKAVSAINLPEFKSLVSGQSAIINELKTAEPVLENKSWYHQTFKNLGYEDRSISGLGRHVLSYTITLPNNKIPTHGFVKTYITSPIFPNNEGSEITLLVNGIKQSTLWISKNQSAWTTEIRDSAMKPGVNKLDYYIDLHRDKEQCTREEYDQIWATVHAESYFETAFTSTSPQAMLNQLPVPFGPNPTMIIPNTLSATDINTFTQLFFKLGQLYGAQQANFSIKTSDEVNEEFIRNHDCILVGTEKTNPWVKLLSSYMPVQVRDDARILTTTNEYVQFSGFKESGLLELVKSPWNNNSAILLISGSNESSLTLAVKILLNDTLRGKLSGNIALINSSDSVGILNSYDNRFRKLWDSTKQYINNFGENTYYYLKNHLQFIVYLIAFLVPLIIYLRRKNK